jgi:hypothetical protein
LVENYRKKKMELNTFDAFATATASSICGFGLAFFLFEKIKSKIHTKAQRVLLTIAAVSFGFGLMSILNEVIGFAFLGLSIRYGKVYEFLIFNVFLLPTILGAVVWLLQPKRSAVEQTIVVKDSENLVIKPSDSSSSFNSKPLIVVGLILLAVIATVQLVPLFSSVQKSKIFDLNDCQTCYKDGSCKNLNLYKGFKVEEADVVMFMSIDGKEQLFSVMNSGDFKCKIVKEKNFAFTCNKYEDFGGGSFWSDQLSFDGKSNFEWSHTSVTKLSGNQFGSQNKTSCQIK